MSYYDTRRGQIELERIKDITKVVLFVVLTVALIIVSITSCGRCSETVDSASANQGAQGSAEDKEYKPRPSLKGVSTYPRLVNNANLLGSDYTPPELTVLRGIPDGTSIQLNFDAATAFTKLYNAIVADGLGLIPLSGYRTYQEQQGIYDWNVELHKSEGMTDEEAREYTLRFVAIPGSSEHQYGRSIDVTIDGTTNHDFHNTEQGRWLMAHAHEFGFVIRYPEDKMEITGIAYEPWHLRYVGLEHAEYMRTNDLCLEEYVDLVRQDNPYAISEQ